MIKGMDISQHQGVVDFAKAKADGIQFVMLRAGFGKNNLDSRFIANIKACNNLNIPCGVYWFSYALSETDAKREAIYCLQAIAPYKVEFPVCFDFENDSMRYAQYNGISINKALASKIANAFLAEVERQGYYAMNYCNKDYSDNIFDISLNRFDLWYARWNTNAPDKSCGIWQATSTGKIDGISGNVDINYSYKDYPSIILDAKLNKLSSGTINDLETVKKERDLWKEKYNKLFVAIEALIENQKYS